MNIPYIPSIDIQTMTEAQQLLTKLDIPPGGLGKLTPLSMRLSGMAGRTRWFPLKRAMLLFAADHGVIAGRETGATTAQRVQLALDEKSAVNSISRQMGARVIVVDAGIDYQFKPRPRSLMPPIGVEMQKPTFVQRKIAMGSNDFTQGTAMSPEQAERAIQLGMDVVKEELKRGLDLIFVGDMGIGNHLSAIAIVTAITGKKIHCDEQTSTIVQQGLTLHKPSNDDTLIKIGGFEMGAMAGAILYAASQRIPIMLDGLASTASALIADQINANVRHFLIAGHKSDEPGHHLALGYLGLDPLLDLSIRTGEGAGALLAFPLIESAMRTLNEVGQRDVE